MARKQWVNMPAADSGSMKRSDFVGDGIDSVDVMGREVTIQADFDKKEATTIATLELTPDGGNAVYDKTTKELALVATESVTATIAADGKATFKLKLSAAGGDKFKVKVKDKSGTEKTLDDIETHRRLFFQVIGMTGVIGLGDYGFWQTEFTKDHREIHLVKIASKGDTARSYNFDYIGSEFSRLFTLAKDKYDTAKDPYCFALVWADCLAQGPRAKTLEKAGVSKRGGAVTIPVGKGQLWKNVDKSATAAKWNLGVKFDYTKDGKNETFTVPDADVTSTYTELTVATRGFPDDVTGKITADVNVAEGFHGGWSFPTQNIIVIATRGWYDVRYTEDSKKAIVMHEAGHKIGLVPNGNGSLAEQSTLDKVHDPAATKFHCNDRGCTMWWTTEYTKSMYCAVCAKSVRKVDLHAPTLPGFARFF